MLTDSQLKAALHFLDSLSGLIQKATQITRKAKAARKLEVSTNDLEDFISRFINIVSCYQELPEYQAQLAQEAQSNDNIDKSTRLFTTYDVIETSYHFVSNQIVLHLCDDPGREY